MLSRRFQVILIGLCFCLSAAMASAQQNTPSTPETPVGKILNLFLEAFNSGDEAQWQLFIDNNWAPSDDPEAATQRLGLFKMIYSDMAGADLRQIVNASDYQISALLQARNSQGQFEWVTAVMDIDSLPPYRLARIGIRPASAPADDIPEGKLTDDEIVAYMDKYLEDLVARDKFSGTVLIAKDGVPFYTRVYGEACKRYQVPNYLDTKFNLGSMNKMFTGVAIMQLMEQGKLSLDDKVGKYLPDIPNKEIADKVTIHQLLTHTSGMQDYWEELFNAKWWEIKTVAQMADLIFDDSLLFEPGTDFHYSNSGPIVLGMIIEKITGQSYYDYVRDHIYIPAGMINTDCYEVDRPVPNLAIGYTRVGYNGMFDPEGGLRNNLFLHAIKGGPAGGGYSTVEDLLQFDIALRQNKLMSRESFDLMTTGKTERRPGLEYAYLIQDKTVNGQRIIGHGGGAPGINSDLAMYLNSGYTVAVMSNYDNAAITVSGRIEELLTK